MTSDDYQVRRDVLAELDWDTRFDSREIGVAVKNNVVTLTGHVASYAQSRAAQEAVESVEGVGAVANELRVQLPANSIRSDTEIAASALRALRSHPAIPATGIRVAVHNGWLSLEGEVELHLQRQEAEHALNTVRGVVGITNTIAIRSQASPAGVKDQILDAFRRLARLEADRIQISTQDGTVTLDGEVSSLRERLQAGSAAWRARGVAQVIDNLTVNPTPPEG